MSCVVSDIDAALWIWVWDTSRSVPELKKCIMRLKVWKQTGEPIFMNTDRLIPYDCLAYFREQNSHLQMVAFKKGCTNRDFHSRSEE